VGVFWRIPSLPYLQLEHIISGHKLPTSTPVIAQAQMRYVRMEKVSNSIPHVRLMSDKLSQHVQSPERRVEESRKNELCSKARTQTSSGSIKSWKKRARVVVQQASVEVKERTGPEKRGRDRAGELIFCERDNERCFFFFWY